MSRPTPRSSSALQELGALRAEVRALGSALGHVITRLEGREAFDTVELLRRLAKSRRAGETSAERELATAVAALDADGGV